MVEVSLEGGSVIQQIDVFEQELVGWVVLDFRFFLVRFSGGSHVWLRERLCSGLFCIDWSMLRRSDLSHW